MKWGKFLMGAMIFFSLYAPVANAEVVTVQGVGTSENAAIQDAKRKAVEEVVGVILKSESTMINFDLVYDSINVRTQGYVNSCKVISKKNVGGNVEVVAQVDVSTESNSQLMKDVELVMNLNDPRLAVVIEHYGDDGGENFKRYAEMCSSSIRSELLKRGFNHVVDKPVNVDYIVTGKLTVGKGRAITLPNWNDISNPQMTQVETGLTKNEAVMDCKIKKVDTDEIIGEFHATASNIGNGELDNQSVVKLATTAAQEVRQIFNREASKVFKSVKIIAYNANSNNIARLEKFLNQTQGVTGVYIRAMEGGKCNIDVSTVLSPQDLYRALSATTKNNLALSLKSFSATVLEISL